VDRAIEPLVVPAHQQLARDHVARARPVDQDLLAVLGVVNGHRPVLHDLSAPFLIPQRETN
jgi:hypothetical protein